MNLAKLRVSNLYKALATPLAEREGDYRAYIDVRRKELISLSKEKEM